jgi:hypothetical protein
MEWTELSRENGYYDSAPEYNKVVVAEIEHWYTKGTRIVELIRVDEDDVDWRTADDNSELSHDWSVKKWRDA